MPEETWQKIPFWDGEEAGWADYAFRTTLYVAGAKPDHRALLGARPAGTSRLLHGRLSRADRTCCHSWCVRTDQRCF